MTDQTDLARRAVACPRWRWMPGMLADENAVPGTGLWRGGRMRVDDSDLPAQPRHGCLPVLTDPATLGCLLALVREVWGRPHLAATYCGGYWSVDDPDDEHFDGDRGFGPWASEAESLVAAMEAAP